MVCLSESRQGLNFRDIICAHLFLHSSSPLFSHPSWPRLLLPSGAHISAVLKILLGLVLNMCPIHRHHPTHIRADTGVLQCCLWVGVERKTGSVMDTKQHILWYYGILKTTNFSHTHFLVIKTFG